MTVDSELREDQSKAVKEAWDTIQESKKELAAEAQYNKLWQLVEDYSYIALRVGFCIAYPAFKVMTSIQDYVNVLMDKGYLENARMVKTTSMIIPTAAMHYSAVNGLPINPLVVAAAAFSVEALTAMFLRPLAINHLDQKVD